MANLWPWLAIAGVGTVHGLNPAPGWVFAAARAAPRQAWTVALAVTGVLAMAFR